MADATPAGVALDPYAGLADLTDLCLRCCLDAIEADRIEHLHQFGGGPGIFDDIAQFLADLLGRLSTADLAWWLRYGLLRPEVERIERDIIEPFKGFVYSHLVWAVMSVHNFIANLRSDLTSAIGGLSTPLSLLPGALGFVLSSTLGAAAGSLTNNLLPLHWITQGLPSWISVPIASGASVVGQAILGAFPMLGPMLSVLGEGVVGGLATHALSTEAPLRGLQAVAGKFVDGFADNLALSIETAYRNAWGLTTSELGKLWADLSPQMVEQAQRAIEAGRPLIEDLWSGFATLPETYLSFLSSTAGTDLAMQPGRALTAAGGLYGMSIAAGSAAHVLSATLNLIPTLNWVGASQLSAYVAEVAAFQPLTNATYGVLINECLAIPLRYHWNQQLRPKLPTEGEIFTMGRKHGISYDEFKTAMAYQGIPDWWVDKMYDFFWTDPSPMWLLRMTEGGIPRITNPGRKEAWLNEWIPGWRSDPMAWLRMKLMLAGYEDVDLDPMIAGMTQRGMQSPVTQFKTSVRAMIREGYWAEEDARGALAPYNVRAEEVHLLFVAEELDYQKRYLDDEVSYYKESFRKGEISEQDLGLALSTIYTRVERVAQEVARERVRALPKPKTTEEPKEAPEVKRLKTQAINSWIKRYRQWEIDARELLLGLTIVVQDPVLAQDMLTTEQRRYREPPEEPAPPPEDPVIASARRQAIASWVKQFREGKIKAKELELYLEPLIPDRETRIQLVHLEQLRYNPAPELLALEEENAELAKVRAEYVRGHLALFQKRAISLDELYAYLLADGLAEQLARATVITQASKRVKVPSPDSLIYRDDVIELLAQAGRESYEQAYLAGEISLETYAAWLQQIVQDADVATYMSDLLSLERFLAGL